MDALAMIAPVNDFPIPTMVILFQISGHRYVKSTQFAGAPLALSMHANTGADPDCVTLTCWFPVAVVTWQKDVVRAIENVSVTLVLAPTPVIVPE